MKGSAACAKARGLILASLLIPLISIDARAQQALSTKTALPPLYGATHDSRTFDLGSAQPSMISNAPSMTVITTESGTRQISPGQKVTPAEFVALLQIVSGGKQTLTIDTTGRASGGNFALSQIRSQIEQLTIPVNVSALQNVALNNATTVLGDLINDGRIIAFSTRNNFGSATVHAINIFNGASGVITSVAADAKLAGILTPYSVDLSLVAQHDIVNSGSIRAGKNLSLEAGNSLVNNGLISSATGNVNFVGTSDIKVTMDGGSTVSAPTGNINFRDRLYDGSANIKLQGGNLVAQNINLYSGCGNVLLQANEISGRVNVFAKNANVTANTPQLNLGQVVLTGDPTIINTQGDVNLESNLIFHGEDLAILAAGNITAKSTVTSIDLSSTTGNGGSLNMVAGYLFEPDSGGQVEDYSTTYRLVDQSPAGGSIILRKVSIKTWSTAPGGIGGDVTAVAFGAGTPSLGSIITAGVNSSATKGTGGQVAMIGRGGVNVMGPINTKGTHGGQVYLGGHGVYSTGDIYFTNGTRTGATIGMDPPIDGVGAAIAVKGNITTSGSTNAAGDVNLTCDADISVNGSILANGVAPSTGSISPAGGYVDLTSTHGSVSVTGTIATSAANAKVPAPGRTSDAGAVNILAKSFVNVGGNIVAHGATNGGGGDGGSGGDVQILTANENPNAFYTGSIQAGYIDTRGGGAINAGTGGDGGSVNLQAGTIKLVHATLGASVITNGGTALTPGIPGPITVQTYGTQPFPDYVDPVSVTPTVVAMPGAMFEVGNAANNGAVGKLISGTDIADKTNGKKVIGSSLDGGGLFVGNVSVQTYGTEFSMDDTSGTHTYRPLDSTGVRTKVTPGQAMGLFGKSRNWSNTLSLNGQGQVIGGDVYSQDFEINRPFKKFDFRSADFANPPTWNIDGPRPTIDLSRSATNKIAGVIQVSSSSGDPTATIVLLAKPLFVDKTGIFTSAKTRLDANGGKLTVTGQFMTDRLILDRPAGSLKIVVGEGAIVQGLGVLPGASVVVAPGKALTISSQGGNFTLPVDIRRIEIPSTYSQVFQLDATHYSLRKNVTLNFLREANGAIFDVQLQGDVRANYLSIKTSNNLLANPVNLSILPGSVLESNSLTIKSSGELSIEGARLQSSGSMTVSSGGRLFIQQMDAESQRNMTFSSKQNLIEVGGSSFTSNLGAIRLDAFGLSSFGVTSSTYGSTSITAATTLSILNTGPVGSGGVLLNDDTSADAATITLKGDLITLNSAYVTATKTLTATSNDDFTANSSLMVAGTGLKVVTNVGDVILDTCLLSNAKGVLSIESKQWGVSINGCDLTSGDFIDGTKGSISITADYEVDIRQTYYPYSNNISTYGGNISVKGFDIKIPDYESLKMTADWGNIILKADFDITVADSQYFQAYSGTTGGGGGIKFEAGVTSPRLSLTSALASPEYTNPDLDSPPNAPGLTNNVGGVLNYRGSDINVLPSLFDLFGGAILFETGATGTISAPYNNFIVEGVAYRERTPRLCNEFVLDTGDDE